MIDTNITPVAIPPLQPVRLSLSLTIEVGAELRRLQSGRSAGPDGVCSRLLRDCAGQLAVPLQRLFNMSLQNEKVLVLWKTSCLIPKLGQPLELNDYRPVALTSHIIKTLETLLVRCMRLQVAEDFDLLLYMLHRTYAYLDVPGSYVSIMFFDFSRAFNTIRPPILKDKLLCMGVAPSLTSWIMDYLTASHSVSAVT